MRKGKQRASERKQAWRDHSHRKQSKALKLRRKKEAEEKAIKMETWLNLPPEEWSDKRRKRNGLPPLPKSDSDSDQAVALA